MTSLFTDRRSINFFDTSKPLEDSKLNDIIDLATLAPSAFNLQPWEVIIVKSEEGKQRLFDLSNKQQKVLDAPVTLIVVGNRNGYAATNPVWDELKKVMGDGVTGAMDAAAHLYGSTEERKIKFAESNAGLLGMSLMYAAQVFGVDSHPMSGLDFDGVKQAFNLSEDQEVVMTIALGYHDEAKTLYPRGYRKSFSQVTRIV